MQNPFELFSLPIQFELDQRLLNERYLARQKHLHPDNFVNADTAQQRFALQQSAALNDALQILKDPILRAEALIALHDTPQNLELQTTQDTAFLMQQLQWREELEAIEQRQDADALAAFNEQVARKTVEFLTALSAALAAENWQLALQFCHKLRFLRKLTDQIEQVEECLFAL